jgi:hypothetical protein
MDGAYYAPNPKLLNSKLWTWSTNVTHRHTDRAVDNFVATIFRYRGILIGSKHVLHSQTKHVPNELNEWMNDQISCCMSHLHADRGGNTRPTRWLLNPLRYKKKFVHIVLTWVRDSYSNIKTFRHTHMHLHPYTPTKLGLSGSTNILIYVRHQNTYSFITEFKTADENRK